MARKTSSTKGKHIAHPAIVLPKGFACLACKARKVRCSGETPVCQSCIRHWKHDGKDISRCVCEWSTKKHKAGAGRRSSSEESTPPSPVVPEAPGSREGPFEPYSTRQSTSAASTWSLPPLRLPETPNSTTALAESYFLSLPFTASPGRAQFDLPPHPHHPGVPGWEYDESPYSSTDSSLASSLTSTPSMRNSNTSAYTSCPPSSSSLALPTQIPPSYPGDDDAFLSSIRQELDEPTNHPRPLSLSLGMTGNEGVAEQGWQQALAARGKGMSAWSPALALRGAFWSLP